MACIFRKLPKRAQNNSSFMIHLRFWHTVNEPIFWVEMPYCVRPFTCTVHIPTANQGYIKQVCPNPKAFDEES